MKRPGEALSASEVAGPRALEVPVGVALGGLPEQFVRAAVPGLGESGLSQQQDQDRERGTPRDRGCGDAHEGLRGAAGAPLGARAPGRAPGVPSGRGCGCPGGSGCGGNSGLDGRLSRRARGDVNGRGRPGRYRARAPAPTLCLWGFHPGCNGSGPAPGDRPLADPLRGAGAGLRTLEGLEGHGMARTLIRLFLDTVATWHKPAQFLRRGEQGWEAISADRALADVESLGAGAAPPGHPPRRPRGPALREPLRVGGRGPGHPRPRRRHRAHLRDAHPRAVPGHPRGLRGPRDHRFERRPARQGPRRPGGTCRSSSSIIPMDPALAEGPSEKSWELVTGRGALARAADPLLFRAEADRHRGPTTSPPSSTPRARPASPRARCSPTPTSRQTPRRA